MRCSALRCVAVCAVCYNVLQCVAVCCSALQGGACLRLHVSCVPWLIQSCDTIHSHVWLECHSPGSLASRTIFWTNLRSTASGQLGYTPLHAFSTLGLWKVEWHDSIASCIYTLVGVHALARLPWVGSVIWTHLNTLVVTRSPTYSRGFRVIWALWPHLKWNRISQRAPHILQNSLVYFTKEPYTLHQKALHISQKRPMYSAIEVYIPQSDTLL